MTTRTVPHPRQVRDIALRDAGVELSIAEISAATVEVMGS